VLSSNELNLENADNKWWSDGELLGSHINYMDLDNMLIYFLVHSKNPDLEVLLSALSTKNRDFTVNRLYTVKQKMMYEIHVNKNEPAEWAIRILEKYGVITDDLRKAIKKVWPQP